MYFKEEKEKYTDSNTRENFKIGGNKFPTWLLILIIIVIVLAGLLLLRSMTRKKKSGQNFGFRFY